MKREEVIFLVQLADALGEAGEKLADFYNNKEHENFKKTKEFILKIQEKISEVVG